MAKNKRASKMKKSAADYDRITTIKLDNRTKERLDHLKEHNETYNEIINKAMNILNLCLKNPILANKILKDIERSKKREDLIKNPEKILKYNARDYIEEEKEESRVEDNKKPFQENIAIKKPEFKISQKIPMKFNSNIPLGFEKAKQEQQKNKRFIYKI